MVPWSDDGESISLVDLVDSIFNFYRGMVYLEWATLG
jgi:hypothetical protein